MMSPPCSVYLQRGKFVLMTPVNSSGSGKHVGGSRMKDHSKDFLCVLLLFGMISIHVGTAWSQDKETIRFSVSRLDGIPNMDPHITFGDLAVHSLGHIYEGLMLNNPETRTVEPALATKWNWVNPTVLEILLRRDVAFHNGEPFDAGSVKFSFDKIFHAKEQGFAPSVYPQFAPQLKKVEVVGKYKVRIHFTKHNNTFLNTAFLFKIIPERYVREHGIEHLKKHPVGTGPFKVARLERGKGAMVKTLYFDKNENYWDPRYPKVKRLVYHYDIPSEKGIQMLMDGKLDAVANTEPRWSLKLKKRGFAVRRKTIGALVWFFFNMHGKRASPIQDIRVRRAIMYALNYEKMKKVVLRNGGRVINQWAFPENTGYNPQLKPFTYDLAKSRELLKRAGYPDGFKMKVVVEDTAKYIIRAITSDLAKVGIEVERVIVDEETIIQIGLAKSQPNSKSRHHLDSMDIEIGDCHDYDFFHNLALQIWTFPSTAILNFSREPDLEGDQLWLNAMEAFGERNASAMWQKVVSHEQQRLGTTTVIEKFKYYATRKDLHWHVHSLWNLRNAYYE